MSEWKWLTVKTIMSIVSFIESYVWKIVFVLKNKIVRNRRIVMFGECHAHIFMNGYDYRKAVEDHVAAPNEALIRKNLLAYQEAGITYVRDGGDIYGAGLLAKRISGEYGIEYRTPVFAIHKQGHYGGIVGYGYDTLQEYAQLVKKAKQQGADFIKIMTTGIMDFQQAGVITGDILNYSEVKEMVHIAHEEGMSVMSHTNGIRGVQEALEAGVDSIEHGNYTNEETIRMLADTKTVWIPTAVTIGNLRGSNRFPEYEVQKILEMAKERIADAFAYDANIGLGSDAGAFCVSHGQGLYDEYELFLEVIGDKEKVDCRILKSEDMIKTRFRVH